MNVVVGSCWSASSRLIFASYTSEIQVSLLQSAGRLSPSFLFFLSNSLTTPHLTIIFCATFSNSIISGIVETQSWTIMKGQGIFKILRTILFIQNYNRHSQFTILKSLDFKQIFKWNTLNIIDGRLQPKEPNFLCLINECQFNYQIKK